MPQRAHLHKPLRHLQQQLGRAVHDAHQLLLGAVEAREDERVADLQVRTKAALIQHAQVHQRTQ